MTKLRSTIAVFIILSLTACGRSDLHAESPNAITLGSIRISGLQADGFVVTASYTGDKNKNSLATLYYCNATDTPSCIPENNFSVDMFQREDRFVGEVRGLHSPDDPGDHFSITVAVDDIDGVQGTPLSISLSLLDSANMQYRNGILYPTWKDDNAAFQSIKKYITVAYTRFNWSDFERADNEFDFTLLTNWVSNWKDRGINKIGFGIMASNGTDQACPEWLFTKISYLKVGTNKHPIYFDSDYLFYVDRFIEALSIAVEPYIDDIEVIDMRFIGPYGEMNIINLPKDQLRNAGYSGPKMYDAYVSMIDSFLARFSPRKLFLNIAYPYRKIVEYATSMGIGLRYDGLTDRVSATYRYMYQYGNYGWGSINNQIWNYKLGSDINFSPTFGAGIPQEDGSFKWMVSDEADWDFFSFQQNDIKEIVPGTEYRVSFKLKCEIYDDHTKPIFIRGRLYTSDYTQRDVDTSSCYDTMNMNEWQNIDFILSTSEPDASIINISIENGDSLAKSGIFYISDLSIRPVLSKELKDPGNWDKTQGDAVPCIFEFAGLHTDYDYIGNAFNNAITYSADFVALNYLDTTEALTEEHQSLIQMLSESIGSNSGSLP